MPSDWVYKPTSRRPPRQIQVTCLTDCGGPGHAPAFRKRCGEPFFVPVVRQFQPLGLKTSILHPQTRLELTYLTNWDSLSDNVSSSFPPPTPPNSTPSRSPHPHHALLLASLGSGPHTPHHPTVGLSVMSCHAFGPKSHRRCLSFA